MLVADDLQNCDDMLEENKNLHTALASITLVYSALSELFFKDLYKENTFSPKNILLEYLTKLDIYSAMTSQTHYFVNRLKMN